MEKPIDVYSKGSGKNNKLADWTRGQIPNSLLERFGLSMETLEDSNSNKRTISGIQNCPECGAPMFALKISASGAKGPYVMFVPQCTINEDIHHGFQNRSRHGTRAPQGNKGGKGGWKRGKGGQKPAPAIPSKPVVVEEKTVEVETKASESAPPTVIKVEVSVTGGTVMHPEVIRSAKYVMAGSRNIYYTGPAGTGKSTGSRHLHMIMMADQRWKNTKRFMITVSLATLVSDLSGYLDRLNGGEYFMTDLVKALQEPGMIVVDEADKGNPNLAGFWNVILADFTITTPGGTFIRHPDCVIVFIGNTTGHSPNKQYGGSVRQDFATLDRFRCFNIDFVEAVEKAAIPNLIPALYERMKTMRIAAAATGCQRIIGTRELERINQTMVIEGFKDPEKAIKAVMRDSSWSRDEMLSVGIAA